MLKAFLLLPSLSLLGLSIISHLSLSSFIYDLISNFVLLYLLLSLILFIIHIYFKNYINSLILLIVVLLNTSNIYSNYIKVWQRQINTQKTKELENTLYIPLNILHFNALVDNIKGEQKFSKYIENNNFDIIVIFELNNYWKMTLKSLSKKYPYTFYYTKEEKYKHMGIISKIKLNNISIIKSNKKSMPIFQILFQLSSNNYHLFLVHTPSPVLSYTFRERNTYMNLLEKKIKNKKNIILIGDFNNTLFSGYLKDFMKNTNLISLNASNFLLTTWKAPFPFLSIDHAFISEELRYKSIETGPRFHSDHYSLNISLIIKN